MLANYFFFTSLFFLLGVLSYYLTPFWPFLALFSLLFRKPKIILILFLAFILGGLYSNFRENLKLNSSNNELKILKIYSPSYYKKYLGFYNGKEYIVYAPYYENFYIGDRINGSFDIYKDRLYIKEVKEVERSKFYKIYRFKDYLNNIIKNSYSINSSEVISGILYGEDIKIKDLKDSFKNSGLSHITAMSGFNLTILSSAVFNLLRFSFLPIPIVNIFSIILILVFIIFTGFQSSVIRAGIMTISLIFCKTIGRIPLSRNIILLSVLLITIFDPKALISDLGFQLSFLAVVGILYLEEYFRRFLRYKTISETFSAQLMVIPLIWYKFGEFNLFSFLNNILLVPFIPILMLLGFISIFLIIFYPINQIMNIPFELFTLAVNNLSKLPKIYLPLPLFLTLILYILIFYMIYKFNKDEKIDFNFTLY
ncbi:MAG: ComEC/Rec2 family competence protein [Minisyncoccia bacterium]